MSIIEKLTAECGDHRDAVAMVRYVQDAGLLLFDPAAPDVIDRVASALAAIESRARIDVIAGGSRYVVVSQAQRVLDEDVPRLLAAVRAVLDLRGAADPVEGIMSALLSDTPKDQRNNDHA